MNFFDGKKVAWQRHGTESTKYVEPITTRKITAHPIGILGHGDGESRTVNISR